MTAARIYGPLISTGDLDGQTRLFTEVFGMREACRTHVEGEQAAALFGPEVRAAEVIVLNTPGTNNGAMLCSFDPPCEELVRDQDSRLAADALKVIDFYAPDHAAAVRHARERGYAVVQEEAAYELEAGAFREAHLWAGDNVATAFLGGPADFFTGYAQVRDRVVSEVLSISSPVSDAAPVLDFYDAVFDWQVIFEYAITDASLAAMLGSGEDVQLRGLCVGNSTREPYFGLMDYGISSAAASLRGRSGPPRRGLVGAVLLADDLTATLSKAREAGGEQAVASAPTDLEMAPFGVTRAAVVLPPHGVWHLVVEATNPAPADR